MTALTLEQRVERIEALLGFDACSTAPRVPWALRRSEVLAETARLWDLGIDDLTGTSRRRRLVIPRSAIVLALRGEPPMSYSEIGRLLGRDHSSIINLERFGGDLYARDLQFAARVTALRRLSEPKQESKAS